MAENNQYKHIPAEKFAFVQENQKIRDKKFETKPVGYFKDAFNRFKKNKGSIVAAWIVILLIVFSIVGPYCYDSNYQKAYATDIDLRRYQYLTPKLPLLEGTGFWDGTEVKEISETLYYRYLGIGIETGNEVIVDVLDKYTVQDSNGQKTMYKVRVDNYHKIDAFTKTFTQEQYEELQEWQNELGIQIIMPWVDYYDKNEAAGYIQNSKVLFKNINVWYQCDAKGTPVLDQNGNLIPHYRTYQAGQGPKDFYESIRIPGDPGIEDPESEMRYKYASVGGSKKTGYSFTVRINAHNYFIYKYGFEPYFLFGSSENGYDVFTRLALGARFSLMFAVLVSAINLVIGAFYGAAEGYYGGTVDIVLERIVEILSGLPTMVITVLFNLHLSGKVGAVVALLYSFILTGWIGMSGMTRMQFYRFKNQEYVLAARTLGARNLRVMFKHIFPNSLGTIITGSVLVIPGVIFSETSLSYLGIINLDSPTRSSVGAMLSAGHTVMTSYPHLVMFPAIFVGLLMVSFNLFGNGLRDAFNPSLRGVED
ncbi:MAG: ABC transporter permease [Clostridia bacterium]|nr:ABC transporter permease [Clostridia bacterium]